MGSHELKVTVNDAILHRHTLPVEYIDILQDMNHNDQSY